MRESTFRVLWGAAVASLVFNIALLVSVTLDLEWAHTRAAGGGFDSFPVALRVIYLAMAVFMAWLLRVLWNHRTRPLDARGGRIARWVGVLFVLSTATQLISRSADERWNAIPAAILALAFFALARRATAATRS